MHFSLLKRRNILLFLCVLCLSIFANPFIYLVRAQDTPIFSFRDRFHPITAENGMVATQETIATKTGLEVLKEGGNAIDAAVTIGFTLAVTLPIAGNIGGGGFMVVHLADSQQTVAIDYREKAPKAATRDMFLDEDGNVDPQKSRFSHLSVGVPGTVAGLILALEKYGTISLERALQPAIELAENGFIITPSLANFLESAKERLTRYPASATIFYHEDGTPYQVGERLIQKDLANSLKLIAREGKDAFYQGEIANAIATDMANNNGLITREDLAAYQPVIRKPVKGTYRGYDIYSMPPPSSGGVHLIQILNLLEPYPLRELGQNSAQTIYLMAESMKLAYADRSKYLGDPDFVNVPVLSLISKQYADRLRSRMSSSRATPSTEIAPGNPFFLFPESNETTHYSVMDRDGNAVANTYTLNFSFGTGITVPGTGMLLNNEMDDFSAKLGVPNAFGLIGGELNAIAPEKRMLSSMTPTIVMKDGDVFLVTGSPGGSRIITTTLQIILNAIDHQMNIAEATNAPRIHHQWLPDELRVEEGLSPDTLALLQQKGYQIATKNAMGSTQSIMKIGDRLAGASDPRRAGALTLGY
ncbi:MAG: gamma-glutamyltransferase [Cyanobacteria bacterium P01_E01_bin.42]